VGEYSVDDILVSGPEKRSDLGSILWFFYFGVFEGIFGISIVGVSPLVLPPEIVGVAIVIGEFIILDSIE
jgi:hypothetical protein